MSTSRASLSLAVAAQLESRIGRRLPAAVERALRDEVDLPGALHAVARVIVRAASALTAGADPRAGLDALIADHSMRDGISPGIARSIVDAVQTEFGATSAAA